LVDLQTISLIVQIVGVSATAVAAVVGVSSYINSNKHAQESRQREIETRQAQLFMPIYAKFSDYSFMKLMDEAWSITWSDYDNFIEKYGEPFDEKANKEVYTMMWTMGNYYEGIGVLVKRGLIDPQFVDDLVSGSTIRVWEKYGPIILEMRKRLNYPQLWEWDEYLYSEIKKIASREHPMLGGLKLGVSTGK
jgi:hypothetical protein